jgi:hypothetical protein
MPKIFLDPVISEVERNLNLIISESLGSPSGDPEWFNMHCAALAYKSLKSMNLKIDNEDNIASVLTNNEYQNFLK